MADGSVLVAAANDAPVRPIDVVYFAGAGGSSEAYRLALGRHPDVALNHNAVAIGVHMFNCPETEHFIADVFDIDPRVIRPGVKWRSFWASPDCRHFSKAKGSAPVSPRVRGLAWVVVKVAKLLGDLAPDVIFLENVEEFVDWGPLLAPDEKGVQRPDPARKGETFGLWCKRLRQCGYVVEYKVDWIAADYGAPTTRKRLLLIARRDGQPIVWPQPTHAPRKVAKSKGLHPYEAAADCIDFSLPCPSIFLTQEECRAMGIRAKRPLEPATMARIAKGVYRYVIASGDPFIVPLTHHGDPRAYDLNDPFRTVTAAHRGELALVQPQLAGGAIVGCGSRAGQSPPRGLDEPLGTVIGKADRCLTAAYLTKFSENSIGEDPGEPLHTVMAGAPRHGLVTQFLTKFRTGATGSDLKDPMPTVTANSYNVRPGGSAPLGVVSACLVPSYGERDGQEPRCRGVEEPYPTVVPTGNGGRLVTAFMEQANTDMVGRDMREPVSTIVGKGCTQRVVTAHLDYPYGSNVGAAAGDAREPLKTVTAGGSHHFLVEEEVSPVGSPISDRLSAFLVKYYGSEVGQDLRDPLHCVTTRARFGLVVVRGELMQITDIGMRMLTPRELAAAQGFPKAYRTDRRIDFATGKVEPVTKTDETRLIGNSVSPIAAAPFIRANLPPEAQGVRVVA
jgi:DNA (cytosine-5)-methyltransferase 1